MGLEGPYISGMSSELTCSCSDLGESSSGVHESPGVG